MLLRAEGFEPWRCDRSCQIGVHLEHLSKLLKCMGSKDSVEIKYQEDGEDVEFIFKNPAEDMVSNFSLKCMDIDAEQLGIPETEYKSSVQMPASEFQRICRDLGAFGDTVTIQVGKEEVQFGASGDMGNGTMSLRNSSSSVDEDEGSETVIDCKEALSQNFALRYPQNFTKATALSKTVGLFMSPDVPLLVEYKIDDLGYVRYYLAPKIDEED